MNLQNPLTPAEKEVSDFLQKNSRFARQWFIENASKDWVDGWRVNQKNRSRLQAQNSTSRGSGSILVRGTRVADADALFQRQMRKSMERSRGSITSDMFARHLDQQGATLSSLVLQGSAIEDPQASTTPSPPISCRKSLRPDLSSLSERDLYMELIRDIAKELNVDALCYKILLNVSLLTKSDRGSLFLARGKPGRRFLISKLFDVTKDSTLDQVIHHPGEAIRVPFGVGIAGHVAATKEIVNIKDCYQDSRFNREVDKMTGYETHSMLCMPILNYEDEVIGVAQIINKRDKSHVFTTEDERVFGDYLNFCGIGLTNAQLFQKSVEEYKRNVTLLRLARKIFHNQQNLDQLVTTIMLESATLLDCERCIVYLVEDDPDKKREINKVFEITNNPDRKSLIEEEDDCESHALDPSKVPEPIMKLARQVASDGEILNIEDFECEHNETNVTVLEASPQNSVTFCEDNHLHSLLCIPILDGEGKVIGVAQLMNKINNMSFSEVDINTFETFAIFVGIGIHNCRTYENVCKLMSKQSVAFEVVCYHATATRQEVDALKDACIPDAATLGIDKWTFDDRPLSVDETLQTCVRMFVESGSVDKFKVPYHVLCRWLCSVKKNYRDVTYHNWRHAFNVTQSMYTMLFTANIKRFMSDLEIFALLVACLCHDMDHRGTNNSFQSKIESPLAKLYTTSTMENHHFDQCVMIINAEGNNIFQSMSDKKYRAVIMVIRSAILSTDLAIYFKKRNSFKDLIEKGDSDVNYWNEDSRKELLRGMMMTGCDVASITKPWDIQYEVAHLVAAEFFEQGDMEKEKLNQQPIPMMDRDKKDEIPKMQVGFIDAICLPLYELLYRFQAETKPMYDGCTSNRDNWQQLADGKSSS